MRHEHGPRRTGGMDLTQHLSQLPILAGSVATTIFVGSYLPMLVRAVRTRDLSSYSRSSLVLANIGNLVQTAYVATLPLGPIWGLHAFYLLATLTMLVLHLRHGRKTAQPSVAPAEDLSRDALSAAHRTARPGVVAPTGVNPSRVRPRPLRASLAGRPG
jgi:hypothetical protein